MYNQKNHLDVLASLHGTDKAIQNGHGYTTFYSEHLPTKVYSLLEIGCYKGASLKMWDEYFGSDCDIHCIDLFKDRDNMSVRACRDAGFVPHEGDQSDIQFLSGIKKQFEVIIDDGSHRADHMIISFKHLFVNNLQPGGLYFVEDLDCCRDEFYYAGEVKEYSDTLLFMVFGFEQNGGYMYNPYFNEGERKVFNNLTESVTLDTETGIVCIKRKS